MNGASPALQSLKAGRNVCVKVAAYRRFEINA